VRAVPLSYEPERRGFAVDQEVGRADSLTHLVLGVLRLLFIALYF